MECWKIYYEKSDFDLWLISITTACRTPTWKPWKFVLGQLIKRFFFWIQLNSSAHCCSIILLLPFGSRRSIDGTMPVMLAPLSPSGTMSLTDEEVSFGWNFFHFLLADEAFCLWDFWFLQNKFVVSVAMSFDHSNFDTSKPFYLRGSNSAFAYLWHIFKCLWL